MKHGLGSNAKIFIDIVTFGLLPTIAIYQMKVENISREEKL